MAIAGIVRGRPTRVPMGERGSCRAGVATVRQEPHPSGINIAAACLAGIQRAKGLARPQFRQPESCLQKWRCIKLHSQQGTDHFVVSLFPVKTFLCTTHDHSLLGEIDSSYWRWQSRERNIRPYHPHLRHIGIRFR